MDVETFYIAVDGQLTNLGVVRTLPADVIEALPHNLDSFLGQQVLKLGSWNDSPEGPLAVALNRSGDLVALVAVAEGQENSLRSTIDRSIGGSTNSTCVS